MNKLSEMDPSEVKNVASNPELNIESLKKLGLIIPTMKGEPGLENAVEEVLENPNNRRKMCK